MLEYADKESASLTSEHSETVQLRTDLIDVLELDCNERLLRDEPDELINEWIRRSSVLQKLITQAETLLLDPTIKRMDSKLLSSYILANLISDLR